MVCFFIVSVFTIYTLHNVDTLESKLYSTSLKKNCLDIAQTGTKHKHLLRTLSMVFTLDPSIVTNDTAMVQEPR